MKLTDNFDSSTDKKIFGETKPTDQHIENAKRLAENLQVIRSFLNRSITITSGLRSLEKNNSLIGSSKKSQHIHGEAWDFIVSGVDGDGLDDLFLRMRMGSIKLPNDCSQVIRETKVRDDGSLAHWIHIGIKTDRWLNEQKQQLNSAIDRGDAISQSKFSKRLTSCEFLLTRDTEHYALIATVPWSAI